MQVKTVEYTHKQNYNKTLVVGHALSDQKAVMELLNAGGMSVAKPLQQQSIEATEISKILSQTYNPTGVSKEQLSVDKVWDGLALDLLMSNRDEKWWGWSDSEALPYLNYWKSIDSKLGFIFVYDTPESFMKQILSKSETLSSDAIAKAADEWCEYNEALLKFYYRNMECSLLVNTQQVKLRTTEYLQQVSKQIGLNSAEIDDNAIVTLQETFEDEPTDPLFSYLVRDVLKEYSNITNLFEEMQSVANLPFNVFNETQYNALDALLALQNEKEQYSDLQEKMRLAREKNDTFQSKISLLQGKQKELAELEKSKTSENELLLTQLMSVQEELEKYYLENRRLKEKKQEAKRYYGAAERVKQQLGYRLGAKMLEESKSFGGVLAMPFTLRAVYKEYKKDMKERGDKKLPPIESYADAYEVPRIKKHLSYRLGEAAIKSMKSPFGIFKLPFALNSAHNDYIASKV